MLPRIDPSADHPGAASPQASLTTVRQDRIHALVRADGDWDLANADSLAELLEEHQKAGRHSVHLDLSGVTFLDGTCLGVLAAAHERQLAKGGTLLITGTTPRIMRLLSLTRLVGVLPTTTVSDRNIAPDRSIVPSRRPSAPQPIIRPA